MLYVYTLAMYAANVHATLHLGDLFWAPSDKGRRVGVLKMGVLQRCDNEHGKGDPQPSECVCVVSGLTYAH